ncbi:11982_t:CDS:2 [Racocetra persica]|uniref:11982_t:CDS:1 n=1 Tax=Racocetra persica TaxID=160502 RepID=A0ACA9MAM5_9GLOM|nr:11982_t:CDS:2 [Racocetra persica]
MTALRHAFESKSTTGLFLKISKGTYPPIPRKLVSSLLKISPNDRPSIEDILKLNFLNNHIERVTKKLGVTLTCQDTSQKLSLDYQSQCEENTVLSNSQLIDNFFKEFECNPVSKVSYGKSCQTKKRQKPAAVNANALSSGGKSQEPRVSFNVKKSENYISDQKSQKSHAKEDLIRKSLVKSAKVMTNRNEDHTENGEIENDNFKSNLSNSTSNADNISMCSKSQNDKVDIIHSYNNNLTSEKTTNETKKPNQSSNVKKINNNSVKYSNASKCNACNLKKIGNNSINNSSNVNNVERAMKTSCNFNQMNSSKKFDIKQKPMVKIDKVCAILKKPSSSSLSTKIDSQSRKTSETTTKNSSTVIKQTISVNVSNTPIALPLPTPPLSPSKKVNSNSENNIMPTKITIASSSLLYSIANKDTKKKSLDTPFSLIEGLKRDLEYLLGFDKFNQCYKLLTLHPKKQKISDENSNQSRMIVREKIIEAKLKLLLNGRGQHNYIPILKELGKQILNY